MSRLTLEDLRVLCDRFVPIRARSDGSFHHPPEIATWWHAHEIGHLLTTERWRWRKPMFALHSDDIFADTKSRQHELRCRELAAMWISSRLLRTVGCSVLVADEIRATDDITLRWPDRGRVAQILRQFNVVRLPRTKRGLESLLIRTTGMR